MLGLAGCSSDGASGSGGPKAGPAYVVSTRVFSPGIDDRTSYLYVVDSLDASTNIEPSTGLEMAGSARLFANEETGWIAVGAGEDSTITRYTVDADNQLIPGDRISLQSYGINSHWSDDLYFVSKNKLYYPDRANEQLLIIDPEAMSIKGAIPLPQTSRPGYQANYSYDSAQGPPALYRRLVRLGKRQDPRRNGASRDRHRH
jgi:hypothetical protein